MNEVAQVISSYLSMVGITATIKPYETNVLLNDIIPQGKTGAMFQQKWGGWTFDYDNTAYSMYHSGEKWNPYDKDEKLDKLLESQRPLTDRAEREKSSRKSAAIPPTARWKFRFTTPMPFTASTSGSRVSSHRRITA